MAKKLSKSKTVKPLVKKYQSAGYNMSGIDPTMRSYYLGEDTANAAEKQYKALYGRNQQFENQAAASEQQATDDKKEANKQLEQYSKQNERQFLSNASTTLAQEGTAALAKQAAAKQAAKQAAEEAVKKTAENAAKAAAANVAKPAALVKGAQGGMEYAAAPLSGAKYGNLILDETGSVVTPGATEAGANLGKAAVDTAATAGSEGVKILGSNMSGLASAGIGLGLTGAGMLVNKKTNDNDYTTFTNKERKGMKWSAGLQGAGSGFSTGAMLGSAIPGVGNIVGGIAGAAVGAGLALKNSKEDIKDAEEAAKDYQDKESQRKAALANQDAQLAAAMNAAFVKARLSGKQTGFGLNSSTTPGMDTTGALYAKTGGSRGQIVPIGDDAVKFVGPKHRDGGIKLDKYTEVEGGETMDKVMMNGGKPNDYFFSAYLKLGGKSFAKRHEDLVKAGASQKKIQDLARKQEAVANKKGEKDRSPEQIASYGGIHKYQTAGKPVYKPADAMTDEEYEIWLNSEGDSQRAVAPNLPWVKDVGEKTDSGNSRATYDFGVKPPVERVPSRRPGPDSTAEEQIDSKGTLTPQKSADAQSNKTASNVTVRDQNKANAKAPSNQQSVAKDSKGGTNNAGQNAANTAAKVNNANTTGTGSTANKTSSTNTPATGTATFPEGRRAINKDEYGVSTSMKGVPAGQHAGNKFYGKVTDQQYADMVTANPWFDFTNFNPADKSQVMAFQKSYNEHVRSGEKIKEDGKFGEQTATARLHVEDVKNIKPIDVTSIPQEDIKINTPAKGTLKAKEKEEQAKIEMSKKGVNGSLVAGLAQLIPVGYSLARPYKEAKGIESQFIGSTGVRGAILPRVNMNAERSAAISNTVAVRKMAEGQSGPGSMIAAIAAGGQQGDQMLRIANQEQEANKQLAAEEARLGQQASQFNASQAMQAQTATADNRSRTDMFNKQLEVSEKQYKREGTLNALDAAAARIAGVVKDERSYKAQERLAKALDATGSYDRFTVYEQLQKESQNADSPYHGMTDIQLKKIASDVYNQQWGEQGGEGDKAKTGGSRKYTSRLGQLSRGKQSFNI